MKKSVFFCFTRGQTYVRFPSLLKMRFQLGFTHEKEKSFSPNFFFPLKKGCFVSHVEKQNFTLYHL